MNPILLESVVLIRYRFLGGVILSFIYRSPTYQIQASEAYCHLSADNAT